MNPKRAFFLVAIAGLITGDCGASAHTFEPGTKQAAEQSTVAERPSTVSRFKLWTRARWEAARKHWVQDNAKFYACNHKWRQQMDGRNYTLHDQREFLFHCMNDFSATRPGDPPAMPSATDRPGEQG